MQRVIRSILLVFILSAASAAQQVQDRGWPRGYKLPSEGQIVLFEPQIASWDDQKHAVALAAVSYVAKGAEKPVLGTIKIETDTLVSPEQRLVKFSTLKITEANFQGLPKEQTQEIVKEIEKNIPDEDRIIALDRVLAYLDKSTIRPKNVAGIKSDPPRLYVSKIPAILVSFDGEPIWSPIKDNELKFAVNTNWDVFQHGPTGMYYLAHGHRPVNCPIVSANCPTMKTGKMFARTCTTRPSSDCRACWSPPIRRS